MHPVASHSANGDLVQVCIPVRELSDMSEAAGGRPFGVNLARINNALRKFKSRIQERVSNSTPVDGRIVLGRTGLASSVLGAISGTVIPPSPSTAPSIVEGTLRSASVSSGSLRATVTPDTAGAAAPLRFAESFEQLGPRPVPPVMTAAIQGAASSSAAGNISTEVNVDLAGPVENLRTQGTPIEGMLFNRPADIQGAAKALSKAIADEIGRLRASNEPQVRDFIDFLQEIANGLDVLTDTIARALAAGSTASPEPILLGKAAEIARKLGNTVTEGIERNRAYIMDCAITSPYFAAGFTFLHACGIDGRIAGIVSRLVSKASKEKNKTIKAKGKTTKAKK
jgi:hypothetical protein